MTMEKTMSLFAGLLCLLSCAGTETDIPSLIPAPSEAEFHKGYYTSDGAVSPDDYCSLAEITVDSVMSGNTGEEGYELEVTRRGILR